MWLTTGMDVKRFLAGAVEAINMTEEAKDVVKAMCAHYPGKVFQFVAGDLTFHIVFFANGHAEVRDGNYPSADIHYISDSETFMRVLRGQRQLREVMDDWSFVVEGAMHETDCFFKALKAAKVM